MALTFIPPFWIWSVRTAFTLSFLAFEITQDLVDHPVIEDEGDDPHLSLASGTDQRVYLVDAFDQLPPTATQGKGVGASLHLVLGWSRLH